MKFTKKKIIWTVVGLVAVVLVVSKLGSKPKISYDTQKVERGEVVEEVTVTGSLAPTQKVALEPEVSGRVVKLNVRSGAEVKTGDVLAELDSRDISSRIVSQRAAVDAARARLNELSAGATAAELQVAEAAVVTATTKRDSAIAAKADAEIALATAKSKAETLSAGKLQALVLDYEKALVDANDALTRSTGAMYTNVDNQLTFGSTSQIHEVNAINSRLTAQSKVAALATTVSGVKVAGTVSAALDAYPAVASGLNAVKAHLEASRELLNYTSNLSSGNLAEYRANVGAALSTISATLSLIDADRTSLDVQARLNDAEINAAQSSLTSATFAVQTAENGVSQAQADLALRQSGNRPEVIASQRAQVEVQEATLNGLYTDLSKRRIVAPIDGVVTDVAIELGETVSPGKAVVSMQTKGNYEITTNISEIDIGKVKVGDNVTITLDAFPKSETWTGKVVKIDPAEKVVEGVIFYQTTVVFDAADERLRSGMTANLTVETEKRTDVLRVPLRGLNQTVSKTTVKVLRNGVSEEVEVTVGLQNNTHAEVLSGLAEGDEVIVGETK